MARARAADLGLLLALLARDISWSPRYHDAARLVPRRLSDAGGGPCDNFRQDEGAVLADKGLLPSFSAAPARKAQVMMSLSRVWGLGFGVWGLGFRV